MAADEERAIRLVATALRLASDCVRRNHGRVFNTAGDAILAEFSSPVSAVRAAIEARLSLVSAPGLAPSDMRFGLHVADVVAENGDLRGDGVNVAARLQAEAAPGDICVSAVLVDHVRRAAPCRFEDLGERPLKGLPEPLRLFRIQSSVDRHIYQTASTVTRPAPALRPNSVAVLPFRVASSADEDQTFLADGLSEDIIHELSRFKSLFVSSRTASQALQSRDPVEIGAALGVRYVLSGSVRKIAARVRMSLSLSDTSSGELVWSDRIERGFDEVFDIMDELTARVAATVSGQIDQAEIRAARIKRPGSMNAYECYLRGIEQHRLGSVADIHARQARDWFQKAQQADPNFARPIAMEVCAWSYLPDFDIAAAERLLHRALELDRADPELHRILGIVQIKLHQDYETSRRHHETAMQLAPNDAYIIGRCAAFYTYVGEPQKALELLDRAETLDPFLPVWIVEERIAALYALEQHEEMSRAARNLAFQTRRTRLYRAAARVARDDLERARDLIREAMADDPALDTGYVISQELFQDKSVLHTMLARLRAAGLPKQANAATAAIQLTA